MFWFLVAVLFLILWLASRSKKPKNDEYARGYRDGYLTLEDRLKEKLATDDVSRESLQQLLAPAGGTPQPQPPAQVVSGNAPQPVAAQAIVQPVITSPVPTDIDAEFDDLTPTVPATPYIPVISPQAPALPREHNPYQTLNIILYLASFLLVASAAALIATSMPSSVKLAGLITVVVLFYTTGMILHAKVAILRPAAIAFIGTGLAILPFVGFALVAFSGMSPQTAWFVISAVGLVAYFAAAITLKSEVISYLTLGFTLSLSCSVVSIVPIGFVWYFVALVIVSTIASTIGFFQPTWVPEVFRKPIDTTGVIVTPIALLAAILTAGAMDLKMFEIVFSAATLHYLVQWLQRRTLAYEAISRAALHVTVLLYFWDWNGFISTGFGTAWLVLASLQALYSLLRVQRASKSRSDTETVFIATSLALILIGLAFWAGSPNSDALSLINWTVFGVIGLLAGLRLRSPTWGYVPLLTTLVVPALLTQTVIQPALPKELLVGLYIALMVLATIAIAHFRTTSNAIRSFLYVAFGVWMLASFASAAFAHNELLVAIALAADAVILLIVSFVTIEASVELIAGLVWFAAIAVYLAYISLPGEWFGLVLGITSAMSFAILAGFHHVRGLIMRRDNMFGLTSCVLIAAAFSIVDVSSLAAHLSYILFAIVALGALYFRSGYQTRSATITKILIITYFTYALVLLGAGIGIGDWWLLGSLAIVSVLLFASSYIERQSWLSLAANAGVWAAVATLLRLVDAPGDWSLLFQAWIVTLLYASQYAYYSAKSDTSRQWIALGSIWAVSLVAAVSGIGAEQGYQYGAAFSLLLGALAAVIHAARSRQRVLLEIGIYGIIAAAQWAVSVTYPNLTLVFYAYWWALALGLVTWLIRNYVQERLIIAMAIITFATGGYALIDGGGYALLFLVQQVIFAAAGALYQKTWALWWGVVASIIAVIYFLRDYVYLWLALLGIFLIGIVVWRLIALSRRS